MITFKDSQKKINNPKRSIKIENVSVEGNQLADENGNIAKAIKEVLPDGVEEFTIRISIELPDEETE